MNVTTSKRVAILHGVNLGMLGSRPVAHYGALNLDALERQISDYASELNLLPSFSQTDDEGRFIGWLHRLSDDADALILNPGAWTHYSWAIRDALEICALPAVEVHLSDVMGREQFRRHSVISDLCIATISGHGPDGYRQALALLARHLKQEEG